MEGWCSVEEPVQCGFARARDDQPRPWVQALLAELAETLAAHGGTAAILRDQAPTSLACRDYADAFVVSTENTLG